MCTQYQSNQSTPSVRHYGNPLYVRVTAQETVAVRERESARESMRQRKTDRERLGRRDCGSTGAGCGDRCGRVYEWVEGASGGESTASCLSASHAQKSLWCTVVYGYVHIRVRLQMRLWGCVCARMCVRMDFAV